jgi:DNA-binding transcriptional LysR family regulator
MDLFRSLEILSSLNNLGSTTAVANRKRISQSTVSKSIAFLQDHVGYQLVERDGRKLRLTHAGQQLVDKALPISRALQDALNQKQSGHLDPTSLAIGVTESILSSWGAALLKSVIRDDQQLRLSLHSHRGTLVLERILSGDYRAGIVAGTSHIPKGIETNHLGEEPMVIMMPPIKTPDRIKNAQEMKHLQLITIEENSGTWKSIATRVSRYKKIELKVDTRVESFTSAGSMCEAGFGPALVPLGVAVSLKVPSSRIIPLSGINREIVFASRKRTLQLPETKKLLDLLRKKFPRFGV